MSMIKLSNISFRYRSNKEKPRFFLNDISLNITKGEFISLLGPNGTGKSTLLKILSGILVPSSGDILFDNQDYKSLNRKYLAGKIAFVPQISTVVFPFTVSEIVVMGRNPHKSFFGFEEKDDLRKTNEALEVVGLSGLNDKYITEISGGELQRTFIARALVQEPEILLLDEPNAHLDIKHQVFIFNLLKRINEMNDITIIAVTHDMNLASEFGKRCVVLKDGKIALDGPSENVITVENIKKVFEVESKLVKFDNEKKHVLILNR